MRNYGLPQRAGGPNLAGGNVQHSARLPIAPDTHQRNSSNLPPLPAGSILERGNVAQTAVDILALCVFALIVCASASAAGLLAYAAYLRLIPQFI